MRCVVLAPGAESSATRVSLTNETEHVHSDAVILPGQKCFLLMTTHLVIVVINAEKNHYLQITNCILGHLQHWCSSSLAAFLASLGQIHSHK